MLKSLNNFPKNMYQYNYTVKCQSRDKMLNKAINGELESRYDIQKTT